MAATIEEYFLTEYNDDLKEIESIRTIYQSALDTFSIRNTGKGWPYQIEKDYKINDKSNSFSFSTTSMILYAIGIYLGKILNDKDNIENSYIQEKDISKYHQLYVSGFIEIIAESNKFDNEEIQIIVNSGTFGYNDPFTLSWLLETVFSFYKESFVKEEIEGLYSFATKLLEVIEGLISKVFSEPHENVLKWIANANTENIIGFEEKTSVNHIFPILKVIQLYDSILRIKKEVRSLARGSFNSEKMSKEELTNWKNANKVKGEIFENYFKAKDLKNYQEKLNNGVKEKLLNRIHNQLSYSSIPNSDFDAAELVFSLEGILLIDKELNLIDENLLFRIFAVVTDSQLRSPYWRPLKPFVTTKQGLALLPLSVEIANSLIRICSLLDSKKRGINYFSAYIDLFRRYAGWLKTRITKCTIKNKNYSGWHSEHVQTENKIHPWETAQVLIFLLDYTIQIQSHIAKTSLRLSNLSVKKLNRDVVKEMNPSEYWTETWQKNEPLLKLVGMQVFDQIKTDFLKPRDFKISKLKKYYSMILFGPPGTGKSSIAEELAKALNWRMITITPSDFIAQGPDEVEARAKIIFKTLEEQSNLVILFDEIDHLILDRDSDHYHSQSPTFQFMTPSMLVKLKDLRSKKSCIFIIATNYEDHIDPAAKRVGRIDKKYMISVPNKEQRKRIIINILKEEISKKFKDFEYSESIIIDDKIISDTVLTTYGELKVLAIAVIEKFIKSDEINNVNISKSLKKEWNNQKPAAIRLNSYKNRFKDNQQPFLEFFILVYLMEEAGFPLESSDKQLILKIANILTGYSNDDKNKNNSLVNLFKKEIKAYIKIESTNNKLAALVSKIDESLRQRHAELFNFGEIQKANTIEN